MNARTRCNREVSFQVTDAALRTIFRIADRVFAESEPRSYFRDRQPVAMDLTAVHANDLQLRLDDLLKADSINFWHDVAGIARNLDRETGKLGNFFVPRFATPERRA